MNQDTVISAIRARTASLRALGAEGVFLFGSRARGDNRPDSDLDVLVEDSGALSLYRLVGIQHVLEDATGLPVHVATRDSFSPKQLITVERDAIRVL